MTDLTPQVGRWPYKIRVDESNSSAQVWFSEVRQQWHWTLIWEDGCPYGTHMHNGTSLTKEGARADIVKTIEWIEDKWPTYEFFEGV